MKNIYHLHGSAFKACSRFFLTSRTNCSKASSYSETIEANTKVIFSVVHAMRHQMLLHTDTSSRLPVTVGVLEKSKLTPKYRGSEVIRLENFRTASVEDIAIVHSRSYISSIEKASENAKASEKGVLQIEDSGPTYVTPSTYEDSLDAVGAGLSLIDSVLAASKFNDNPPVGFSLIRPPGNHAGPEEAKGFCIFNNVAIAARYVQRVHGLKRVFIIDFDVHHGNGTNDIFHDDPDVFFLSTHYDGRYPRGSGKFDDIGCGKGEGATLNLPLPNFSGDIAMRTAFDEVIVPSAQRFKPDIILVSAGYSGHVWEPMGSFQMTTGTYYMLASGIKQLAKDLCGGRCMFFLEGGYNLTSLSNTVADSFRAFLGEASMAQKIDFDYNIEWVLRDEPLCEVKQAIQRTKHLHSL